MDKSKKTRPGKSMPAGKRKPKRGERTEKVARCTKLKPRTDEEAQTILSVFFLQMSIDVTEELADQMREVHSNFMQEILPRPDAPPGGQPVHIPISEMRFGPAPKLPKKH